MDSKQIITTIGLTGIALCIVPNHANHEICERIERDGHLEVRTGGETAQEAPNKLGAHFIFNVTSTALRI